MRGFRFWSILYSERCAKKLFSALSKFKCLAAKHSTLNLFSTYVSTDGSKGQCHSSRVSFVVAGRDSCRLGCWLFIYYYFYISSDPFVLFGGNILHDPRINCLKSWVQLWLFEGKRAGPRAQRAWDRAPYSWNMVNLFSFGCHVIDRAYVCMYEREDPCAVLGCNNDHLFLV